ncbi:Rab-GTPase-TBC domain containing protein, putative [Angomonas deanei]|uniref:Rab-GTPase-TBC domain containing protein, putative n=1 Tax=Angomonas deanei TaxID=59799 RepID=A0A7G2CH31_9TRYP|nr:Rab-GTPase-TBC domain containing protein, putative [Angomonas deanei]
MSGTETTNDTSSSAVTQYGFYKYPPAGVGVNRGEALAPSKKEFEGQRDQQPWKEEERWWLCSFAVYERLRRAGVATDEETTYFRNQWRHRLTAADPGGILRRLLWGYLSQQSVKVGEAAEGEVPAAVRDAIERDIGRTLPSHCLFAAADGIGRQSLRRVLLRLSAQDPEVGYCQGMAFPVATLLLHCPEEECYGVMRRLWWGRRWRLRDLFSPHFPLLTALLSILQQQIAQLLPRLHRHLAEEEMELSAIVAPWFLTLFTHQLPTALLARVWDFFILQGWRVLLQVAVYLLRKEEPVLVTLSMEEAVLHMRSDTTYQRVVDTETFIRAVLRVPIDDKVVEGLFPC